MDINLTCPINQLGYGQAARNIFKTLVKNGHNVALWPIGNIKLDTKEEIPLVQRAIYNQSSYNKDAPSIRLYHQFDLAQHIGSGPRIGFPIFELDAFNQIELHHLKSQDAIFVCSHWAKNVVEKYIKIPTYVVPLGVDQSTFNAKEHKKEDKDPFVFLNIGKWEVRKGHDILVTAFDLAFEENDNVELWMMCENPFLNEEQSKQWHDVYLNSKMGLAGKVKILPRVSSHSEVANIMSFADCGIFPARAEGWNMELLEMISMKKPVITTFYSGHTEYCNSNNSLLVYPNTIEPAYDGMWFNGQGNWASISEANIYDIKTHMRTIYNKEWRPTDLDFIYSWEHSVNSLIKHLENICGL